MKIRFLLQIIPGILSLLFSGMAAADASTVKLVNLLVQEGVLSREKAEILLKQVAEDAEPKANVAEPKAAVAKTEATNAGGESGGEGNGKNKVIRMQYVPRVRQTERNTRRGQEGHVGTGEPAQWGDHEDFLHHGWIVLPGVGTSVCVLTMIFFPTQTHR